MKPKISEQDYVSASEHYDGWCTECQEFTGRCEPDARRYECPCCGERTMYGAEEALIRELFEFED